MLMKRTVPNFVILFGGLLAILGGPDGIEAGKQCSIEERLHISLVKVQSPGKVLLETSGVQRKEDCYKACCHSNIAGCNIASYFKRGNIGVCQLLKCEPLSLCIWIHSPNSVVGRIRGTNSSTAVPPGYSINILSPGNKIQTTTAKPTLPIHVDKEFNIHPIRPQDRNMKPQATISNQGKVEPPKVGLNNSMTNGNTQKNKEENNHTEKGFFARIRDFLMGGGEKENSGKTPQNQQTKNANQVGNQKGVVGKNTNLNAFNSQTTTQKPGVVTTKTTTRLTTKPISLAERKRLLAQERARQIKIQREKERERQLKEAREKAQQKKLELLKAREKAMQTERDKQREILRKKIEEQQNAYLKLQKEKVLKHEPIDEFNILPIDYIAPIATTPSPSRINSLQNKYNGKSTTQNSNSAANSQLQIPKPPLHHHHFESNRQNVQRPPVAKKGQEQIFKASITALLIAICSVTLLGIIVLIVVWKKYWIGDEIRYSALRSYDTHDPDYDQSETLLERGPKHTLNSI